MAMMTSRKGMRRQLKKKERKVREEERRGAAGFRGCEESEGGE